MIAQMNMMRSCALLHAYAHWPLNILLKAKQLWQAVFGVKASMQALNIKAF